MAVFKPREDYVITPIIIILNVLVFIAMVASGVSFIYPESEDLLKWGANFKPLTLDGEWWRIVSCCFVHIGILHLAMNMYAFYYIGIMLEPLLGKARFVTAYLIAGITSSLLSMVWHDFSVSAGASGAIFGMYGVFLAMLTTNLIAMEHRKALLSSIGTFILFNLAFGTLGSIDNAGHIGGLIGGIILGYLFYPSLRHPSQKILKYALIIAAIVLAVFATVAVWKFIPKDSLTYQQKMDAFAANETRAVDIGKLPESDQPAAIRDIGIPAWQENLKLLDEISQLQNLPDNVKKKNTLLTTYSQLRLSSFDMYYKAMTEHSNQYDRQIDSVNKQIESLLKQLKEAQE